MAQGCLSGVTRIGIGGVLERAHGLRGLGIDSIQVGRVVVENLHFIQLPFCDHNVRRLRSATLEPTAYVSA